MLENIKNKIIQNLCRNYKQKNNFHFQYNAVSSFNALMVQKSFCPHTKDKEVK